MNKGKKKSTFKSTINRKKIENQILETLTKSNKPLSTSEISFIINKSWHTVLRHCLDLELEDKVSKFNMGRVSALLIKK